MTLLHKTDIAAVGRDSHLCFTVQDQGSGLLVPDSIELVGLRPEDAEQFGGDNVALARIIDAVNIHDTAAPPCHESLLQCPRTGRAEGVVARDSWSQNSFNRPIANNSIPIQSEISVLLQFLARTFDDTEISDVGK